jgi:ABC-type cobalamin/Fe3+-siderophores transport system ATPase subunit
MTAKPSIIVIGPDGVGKTTLVRMISSRLDIPSFKCPNEKQIFREGGRSSLAFDYNLTHFLKQTGHRFVSDRGYPCEWVYSRVFKRETDHDLLSLIDTNHALMGTRVLYLYSSVPPFEEDDIVPSECYGDIKDAYDNFCDAWTECQVTRLDTARMLIEYHQNHRDVSGQLAYDAVKLMGIPLSLPHEWRADGTWFSCIYCGTGAGGPHVASPDPGMCPRRIA